MFGTMILVSLAGSVKEYAQDITGYGDHIAAGGQTVSLFTAQRQAREFFRTAGAEWTALSFWTVLDDSGLAYRVEINRRGTHVIEAAAPLPSVGNVREVYEA
jgi:hypothetical protein